MAAVASHGLCQAQTTAAAYPNLKIAILPDFHALHPPRRAAHSSYAIKAPAAGAATRAARASLPGHWAVCMLLWAHPRGPIADPLLYLGHCRPTCPLHDISPIFRRCCGPTRCEPVPRGRRARVSAHIADGGSELLSMIIRACLCCTSQGAAGGSGMPTPVCSCGAMGGGS